MKAARGRLDLSIAHLAQLLGVDRSTVSRYEDGTRDIPPPVSRLIDAMEIIRGVRERLEQIADK
jgi:predicted transcriptional regulator